MNKGRGAPILQKNFTSCEGGDDIKAEKKRKGKKEAGKGNRSFKGDMTPSCAGEKRSQREGKHTARGCSFSRADWHIYYEKKAKRKRRVWGIISKNPRKGGNRMKRPEKRGITKGERWN